MQGSRTGKGRSSSELYQCADKLRPSFACPSCSVWSISHAFLSRWDPQLPSYPSKLIELVWTSKGSSETWPSQSIELASRKPYLRRSQAERPIGWTSLVVAVCLKGCFSHFKLIISACLRFDSLSNFLLISIGDRFEGLGWGFVP